MTLFPFIHFFTFVLLIYHAVYIFFKNPKALLNRVCAAFISCFGIWSFAFIFVHNPYYSKHTAKIFLHISSIGWASYATLFFWFMLAFTQKTLWLKKKWIYPLFIVLPLFFIYKQWTNSLFSDLIEKPYGWKPVIDQSIWPLFVFLYTLLFSIIALYINFRFIRTTRNPLLEKQAKIIFTIAAFTIAGGVIVSIILPSLNIHMIPNISHIFALIWAFGSVYAMVKYKFLSITPATAADNIISTMFDCLILLNMQGEIVTVNKATTDLLAYEADELKGKSVGFLFKKGELTDDLFKKTPGKRIIKNKEIIFNSRDGKDIPVLFSDSVLRDDAGTGVGIVCVAKDISERKKLEEEIFKSKKLQSIGVLAGGIAHDYNNLLSVIVGNITLVKDVISPGHKAYQFLRQSEQAALKAAELAEKFITFSPGGWLVREKFTLGNLLTKLLNSEPRFRETDVSFDINISKDLAPIYGDKGQINQVIQNLLFNAIEAIEARYKSNEGQISIRAENRTLNPKNQFHLKPGDYVNISIEDNGTGIPLEMMDKIFDPYFSTKDRGSQKGMGLGLTLCYWILKRHEGYIQVESQPGNGTTVTLYLPAYKE